MGYLKKYEIINPSDECYIYSDDVRFSQIACYYLGNGFYGLKSESGELVLPIFKPITDVLNMNEIEFKQFIHDNKKELIKVFRSFEYADERTSLNNIGEKAEKIAEMLEKETENE